MIMFESFNVQRAWAVHHQSQCSSVCPWRRWLPGSYYLHPTERERERERFSSSSICPDIAKEFNKCDSDSDPAESIRKYEGKNPVKNNPWSLYYWHWAGVKLPGTWDHHLLLPSRGENVCVCVCVCVCVWPIGLLLTLLFYTFPGIFVCNTYIHTHTLSVFCSFSVHLSPLSLFLFIFFLFLFPCEAGQWCRVRWIWCYVHYLLFLSCTALVEVISRAFLLLSVVLYLFT